MCRHNPRRMSEGVWAFVVHAASTYTSDKERNDIKWVWLMAIYGRLIWSPKAAHPAPPWLVLKHLYFHYSFLLNVDTLIRESGINIWSGEWNQIKEINPYPIKVSKSHGQLIEWSSLCFSSTQPFSHYYIMRVGECQGFQFRVVNLPIGALGTSREVRGDL